MRVESDAAAFTSETFRAPETDTLELSISKVSGTGSNAITRPLAPTNSENLIV